MVIINGLLKDGRIVRLEASNALRFFGLTNYIVSIAYPNARPERLKLLVDAN